MNYTISIERWKKFTPIERLGNIGSEYGRALAFKNTNDNERFSGAFNRLFQLINATIELENNTARRHEMMLMKQATIEVFERPDSPLLEIYRQMMQNYFNQFGMLALRRKGIIN